MSDFENNLNGADNGVSEENVTVKEVAEEAIHEPEIKTVSAEEVTAAQEEAVPVQPTPVYVQPAPAYTNEYTYIPEPAVKKEGKGGKIALGVIAALLGVFIVVVVTLSVYTAILRNQGIDLNVDKQGQVDQFPDWSNGRPDYSPEKPSDTSVPEGTLSTLPDDEEDAPAATVNRDFPTLEQLAAPEDAMSIPDIYEKVAPSVVGISSMTRTSISTGTGVIFTEDGYIFTNAHVISGAQEVSVLLSDGSEHEATIVGYDTQSDLAVLKIEAQGLTPCEFGISDDLRIGELVVAIGNPLGFDLYGSITSGIISGKNRQVTVEDREMVLLQTNAAINAGNSGGPLINAYGHVIGINSVKISETAGEGVGFAIPIDDAIPVINDLMQYGYVPTRAMLGISGEDITAIMSMFYNMPQGVYIRDVTPGSGADNAGIKVDDIIIGADGETVTSMDDLNKIKRRHSAGESMTITLYRNGKAVDIEVILDEATQAS